MKRALLIGTIMILLVPQLSWGQIPQTMSYQGVVTDASGVAIDGNVGLLFILWDAAAEGTELWAESQPAIPVSNGIFNVILGSVNALNIPFDKQYWLGVTVGTDPELTPRVLLTASPYSLSTQLDSDLTTIAGFTHTDGNFIVSDGTKWVLESGATARTSLGLGTMALQSSDAVDINGGQIDGSIIGGTTPGAGTFTSLDVEGTATATAFVGDGSALTNLPGGGGGTVTSITAGTGLTGGTITTTGTISVDVGTTANKIVQLDGSGKLPAVDGSALTNLPNGGGTVTSVTASAPLASTGGASPDISLNNSGVTAGTYSKLTVTAKGLVTSGSIPSVDDLSDGSTSGGAGNLFLGSSAGAAIESGGIYNTGLGFEALKATTAGDLNTASGYRALYSNTIGSENTASGYMALFYNTTGGYNTASGSNALFSNTTGGENTASGYQALKSNTTGSWNTASGYMALFSNTTGSWNTASGYQALNLNTMGNKNTALGYKALSLNTIGSFNTASGYRALLSNTIGSANTASGYQALLNTTGSQNTASGYNALFSNTTGQNNTASGSNALFSNTTGASNTASGYQALSSNTVGNFNTASGVQALQSNTTGINNTASGYLALESNTTGNQNTASGRSAIYSNTTGSQNTASGISALFSNTTANYNTAFGSFSLINANRTADIYAQNTAFGYKAGDVITTGQHNVIIGALSDPSAATAVNQIVIGFGATGTGDNEIALGNSSITAIKAQVTSITAYSDRRIKRDIQDGDLGLAFINDLRPVKYKLKNPADYPEPLLEERFRSGKDERAEDDETVYDGLIAQQVKSSLDKMGVSWSGWSEDENTGKQGIQYGALVVPLIKAVQELSAKVEELEGQLKHLEVTDAALTVNNGKDQLVRSN